MTTADRPTGPTVSATERRTLVELAGVDERIRLLVARLDALPENAIVERLEQEAEERRRRDRDARRIAHDVTGTLHRLRADAARLRARRRDDIAGLRAVTDRERRRDLRHDLEVAERRLGELEADIAREERTLAMFGHAGDTGASVAESRPDEDDRLRLAREEAADVTVRIDRELAALRERSVHLRGELPAEVLIRYEEGERDQGMGAADLAGATCRCCCIELDNASVRRIADTPADRLVTCPECGVLLLRQEA